MNKVGRPTNEEIARRKKKKVIKALGYLGLFLLVFGLSYSLFTVTLNGRRVNRIRAGKVSLRITDKNGVDETEGFAINVDGSMPISDEEGKETSPYEFNLTNDGNSDVNYKMYVESDFVSTLVGTIGTSEAMNPKYIKYELIKNGEAQDIKSLSDNKIDVGTIRKNETNRYELRLWIDVDADNSVMGQTFVGRIKVEGSQLLGNKSGNPYILKAYKYNIEHNDLGTVGETICLNGEEEGCVETGCIYDKNEGACPIGTIIKYQVNDEEVKYFHVLHDDGATMTLQQRENTIAKVKWGYLSVLGPNTVLSEIESATSSWNNVNDMTYKLGETEFVKGSNPYTGCSYTSDNASIECTSNSYVMAERTAKARIISIQEILNTGYTNNWNGSGGGFFIPGVSYTFLRNYARSSFSDKYLTYDPNGDDYLILNTIGNAPGTNLHIEYGAGIQPNNGDTNYGARAVIEINK